MANELIVVQPSTPPEVKDKALEILDVLGGMDSLGVWIGASNFLLKNGKISGLPTYNLIFNYTSNQYTEMPIGELEVEFVNPYSSSIYIASGVKVRLKHKYGRLTPISRTSMVYLVINRKERYFRCSFTRAVEQLIGLKLFPFGED